LVSVYGLERQREVWSVQRPLIELEPEANDEPSELTQSIALSTRI
jgi:hypothetical protein